MSPASPCSLWFASRSRAGHPHPAPGDLPRDHRGAEQPPGVCGAPLGCCRNSPAPSRAWAQELQGMESPGAVPGARCRAWTKPLGQPPSSSDQGGCRALVRGGASAGHHPPGGPVQQHFGAFPAFCGLHWEQQEAACPARCCCPAARCGSAIILQAPRGDPGAQLCWDTLVPGVRQGEPPGAALSHLLSTLHPWAGPCCRGRMLLRACEAAGGAEGAVKSPGMGSP